MAFLGNLIRCKFGPNPLIVLGDKSNSRFHAPTQGAGLRYVLHRLGFRVVLLAEYGTSISCPDCFREVKYCVKRPSPRPFSVRHGCTVWSSARAIHGRGNATVLGKSGTETFLAVTNFRRIWWAFVHGRDHPLVANARLKIFRTIHNTISLSRVWTLTRGSGSTSWVGVDRGRR
jgi:hypothetical protein